MKYKSFEKIEQLYAIVMPRKSAQFMTTNQPQPTGEMGTCAGREAGLLSDHHSQPHRKIVTCVNWQPLPPVSLGTCAMFFKVHDGRHTKRDDCLGWQAAIEWNPEIERVRKEMMRRFSDKLSMEEIASFAYETFGQPAQSGMGARERAEKAAREIRDSFRTSEGIILNDGCEKTLADIIERAWAGEGK